MQVTIDLPLPNGEKLRNRWADQCCDGRVTDVFDLGVQLWHLKWHSCGIDRLLNMQLTLLSSLSINPVVVIKAVSSIRALLGF